MAGLGVREASAAELEDWDAHTVDVVGGSVHQSRAWADHQARLGWQPHFLVTADGRRTLSLEHCWLIGRGREAYLPRGPVAAGDPAVEVAERLRAISDYLAGRDIDAIVSDSEVEAASGYASLVHALGFEQVDEQQPSRHRIRIVLGAGETSEARFRNLSASARQRVRGARRAGLRVVAMDAAHPRSDQFAAVDSLYDVIADTAQRRAFRIVQRERFDGWANSALGAGLATLLTVRAPDERLLGGGLFHRHGGRLTYFIAGDLASTRRQYPGVMHLLVWSAIELAVADGLGEVDLGGADLRGARRRPVPGEPMHGVLAFKESFGGEWLELSGCQQRVMHPLRYHLGHASQLVNARLHRPRAAQLEHHATVR